MESQLGTSSQNSNVTVVGAELSKNNSGHQRSPPRKLAVPPAGTSARRAQRVIYSSFQWTLKYSLYLLIQVSTVSIYPLYQYIHCDNISTVTIYQL